MKSRAALLLAVGCCAPGIFLCAPAARGAEVVEGVAAIVGDEVVLLSEVREAWHGYVNRVRARGEQLSQEDLMQLRSTALQTLIDEKLVLQVAKKQNLSASEEEIDESISGIAQDEGMTVDAIYEAAAAQGLDKKTYREQLGRQITGDGSWRAGLAVERVGRARVGMLICFDWRFPEAARVLALQGADVIAHPSNLVFPNAQEAMRVRALENRLYTVTANRTGTESRPGGRVPFTGRSQVVDPNGEVVARASKTASVAMAVDCDLALARDKRLTARTPLFSNRRPQFYRSLARGRTRRHTAPR